MGFSGLVLFTCMFKMCLCISDFPLEKKISFIWCFLAQVLPPSCQMVQCVAEIFELVDIASEAIQAVEGSCSLDTFSNAVKFLHKLRCSPKWDELGREVEALKANKGTVGIVGICTGGTVD